MSFTLDSSAFPNAPDRLAINATWLMKLRWVAVVGQLTTIVVVAFGLGIPVRLMPLLAALATTTVTNLVFTIWLERRSRSVNGQRPASGWNHVFMALMLLDLAVLTALLFFTGGHTNPFALFYFVNLALSGILLPARRAWLLTALSTVSFAGLFYYHLPLAELQRPETLRSVRDLEEFTLSHRGLLIAFAACATVIVYFVTRMTAELERRDEALRRSEMRQARSERWEALGTLSAGAAHELASPLTTIAIISREIERALHLAKVSQPIISDVDVIRKEVDRCRTILDRMSIDGGHVTSESKTFVGAQHLMDATLDELSAEPGSLHLFMDETARQRTVQVPVLSISMALRGILQNALDAAPDGSVELRVTDDATHLAVIVRDQGPGMTADVLRRADEPFFTTKEAGEGMGLGRFLARSIVERVGGSFDTESIVGVGTQVTVRIPWTEKEETEDEDE